MEINPEIVEEACELAEEVLQRRLSASRDTGIQSSQFSAGASASTVLDGSTDSSQHSGGRMHGFTETEAAHLQAATSMIGEKAAEGDVAAAAAFAALLDAQTRRAALASSKDTALEAAAPATPAGSWRGLVNGGARPAEESQIAA